MTPDHGVAGAVVRITGAYFCQEPEPVEDPCVVAGSVQFGTVPGQPTLWTDTEIMVEIPQGLVEPVALRVLAGGHTSNSVTFTPD